MRSTIKWILVLSFFWFFYHQCTIHHHAHAATIPYKSPPVDQTYDRFNPILISLGASTFEANVLLTLATAEMAGTQDIDKACNRWSCDNKSSYSFWQIQCIDREGKWNKSRWRWWLKEKLSMPNFKCSMLNEDDVIASRSALLILRAFNWGNLIKKKDYITLMMRWGHGPDKHYRIIILRTIYAAIIKKRAAS